MRRLLYLILILGLVAIPLQSSQASESEGRVKCRSTSAVPHSPITVSIPSLLTQFPKTIKLETNCGTIEIATVGNKAPLTLSVLASLANQGFYDNSLCHRLTTAGIWVLLCGDPTATGDNFGLPFSYQDENLPTNILNNYPAGTVAMANSGPNTNRNIFFLVYQDTTLPPSYTIWGHVTQGLNIVKAIAAAGVVGGSTDGFPVQKIALLKVKVK